MKFINETNTGGLSSSLSFASTTSFLLGLGFLGLAFYPILANHKYSIKIKSHLLTNTKNATKKKENYFGDILHFLKEKLRIELGLSQELVEFSKLGIIQIRSFTGLSTFGSLFIFPKFEQLLFFLSHSLRNKRRFSIIG